MGHFAAWAGEHGSLLSSVMTSAACNFYGLEGSRSRHTSERLLDFSKNLSQSLVRESALRECRYLVHDHFI